MNTEGLVKGFRALTVVVCLLGAAASLADDSIVQTLSGSGGRTSRPFSVADHWEIQWEAKGDMFQVFLYSAGGELVGVPANQPRAGNGSSYVQRGGRYYLQINSLDTWTLRIVQLDPKKSSEK